MTNFNLSIAFLFQTRTCDLTDKNYQRILSSYQCTGRISGDIYVTRQMCIQSEEQVAEELRKEVKEHKIKSVFIGTDHFPMEDHLQEEMDNLKKMEKGWKFDVSVNTNFDLLKSRATMMLCITV